MGLLHKLFNLETPEKVLAFKGFMMVNRNHQRCYVGSGPEEAYCMTQLLIGRLQKQWCFIMLMKLNTCSTSTDWMIVVDLDGFHEYPALVAHFFDVWTGSHYNAGNGIFLDRVSNKGQLERKYDHILVHKQFPLDCRLLKVFNLRTPNKAMAIKRFIEDQPFPSSGCAMLITGKKKPIDSLPWIIAPHHQGHVPWEHS